MSYQNLVLGNGSDKPDQDLNVNSITVQQLNVQNITPVAVENYFVDFSVNGLPLSIGTLTQVSGGVITGGDLPGLSPAVLEYEVPVDGFYLADLLVFYSSGLTPTTIKSRIAKDATTLEFSVNTVNNIVGFDGTQISLNPYIFSAGDKITFYVESDTTCVVNLFGRITRIY